MEHRHNSVLPERSDATDMVDVGLQDIDDIHFDQFAATIGGD